MIYVAVLRGHEPPIPLYFMGLKLMPKCAKTKALKYYSLFHMYKNHVVYHVYQAGGGGGGGGGHTTLVHWYL